LAPNGLPFDVTYLKSVDSGDFAKKQRDGRFISS
jgi:hypothetical protein